MSTSSPQSLTKENSNNATTKLSSVIEFEPPLACVRRILKRSLPSSTNVGKDACGALTRACGIFIIYLTACSNDFARENKRQTITANDVIAAMKELDFDDFTPDMMQFLENYRAAERTKKSAKAIAAVDAAASLNDSTNIDGETPTSKVSGEGDDDHSPAAGADDDALADEDDDDDEGEEVVGDVYDDDADEEVDEDDQNAAEEEEEVDDDLVDEEEAVVDHHDDDDQPQVPVALWNNDKKREADDHDGDVKLDEDNAGADISPSPKRPKL